MSQQSYFHKFVLQIHSTYLQGYYCSIIYNFKRLENLNMNLVIDF